MLTKFVIQTNSHQGALLCGALTKTDNFMKLTQIRFTVDST